MTPPAAGHSGPATHYELFAGLRADGVRYLVTGAVALVLHGIPRLTPDLDLLVHPEAGNLARLEHRLSAWGYASIAAAGDATAGAAVRRFRHPTSALEEIDVVLPPPGGFERLEARAASAALVDLCIPVVGAEELRELKAAAPAASAREDAQGLDLLAALRAGQERGENDTLREQIRKFSRWSVAARLDWLLAAARLRKGLSPEAKPMTRGLVRRRGWYGRQ